MFSRLELLIGKDGVERLKSKKVLVFGVLISLKKENGQEI